MIVKSIPQDVINHIETFKELRKLKAFVVKILQRLIDKPFWLWIVPNTNTNSLPSLTEKVKQFFSSDFYQYKKHTLQAYVKMLMRFNVDGQCLLITPTGESPTAGCPNGGEPNGNVCQQRPEKPTTNEA